MIWILTTAKKKTWLDDDKRLRRRRLILWHHVLAAKSKDESRPSLLYMYMHTGSYYAFTNSLHVLYAYYCNNYSLSAFVGESAGASNHNFIEHLSSQSCGVASKNLDAPDTRHKLACYGCEEHQDLTFRQRLQFGTHCQCVRESSTSISFKKQLKTFLFRRYRALSHNCIVFFFFWSRLYLHFILEIGVDK